MLAVFIEFIVNVAIRLNLAQTCSVARIFQCWAARIDAEQVKSVDSHKRYGEQTEDHSMIYLEWSHRDKGQYAKVHLFQDLFGQWTLIGNYWGVEKPAGQIRRQVFNSLGEGIDALELIVKRRAGHGFKLVRSHIQ